MIFPFYFFYRPRRRSRWYILIAGVLVLAVCVGIILWYRDLIQSAIEFNGR